MKQYLDMSDDRIDRFPLISQRGNFSGKASALIRSIISGDWFRSDPATGGVPTYVQRNNQFHLNQGPVDMEIKFARETQSPTSLVSTHGNSPKTQNADLTWLYEEGTGQGNGVETFIWHTFLKPAEYPFSTLPTKY